MQISAGGVLFPFVAKDDETIRWPTNLDRNAIEERLRKVGQLAAHHKLIEISSRFSNVATMSAAEIASKVIATLTWLINVPEHDRVNYQALTKELEMVALNLKNLK